MVTPQPRTISIGERRFAYPTATDAARSRVMRGNRRVDTVPERRLRSELHRAGLRFRKDFAIRPDQGRPIRADIAFTRCKIAVFVDGCFWHACPEHGTSPKSNSAYWAAKLERNVERDGEIERRLRAAGWAVVRVWEHESAEAAASRVGDCILSRRVSQE